MIPLRVVYRIIEALRALHIRRYTHSTISTPFFWAIHPSNDIWFLSSPDTTLLHLPWLVVKNSSTIRHLSYELDKILMRRVFVDVVVSVLFAFELHDEPVGRVTLITVSKWYLSRELFLGINTQLGLLDCCSFLRRKL